MFNQFRWYYNSAITILSLDEGHDNIGRKGHYSNTKVRDMIRTYEYTETEQGNFLIQDFVKVEGRNEFPIPPWMTIEHNRIPRGAICKLVSSLNSAISNRIAGNNKGFQMKYLSKKKPTEYLHFEDKNYPNWLRNIPSRYWYRDKNGKRKTISYSNIEKKRGFEIIHEKDTDRYFLHAPMEVGWFPTDDIRSDNQGKYDVGKNKLISLDPGVRKFLVGYDPEGACVFIGESANLELTRLMLEIDKIEGGIKVRRKWKRIKNLVSELHWKTASYLVRTFDTILLPDFRVSQMIRSKKLSKRTKREMTMFSFYSFKEKLTNKCLNYNKRLFIVDESFTSRTCGRCGTLNNMEGKEVYSCCSCGLEVDRDVLGARNILIKNTSLRLG